MSIQGRGLRDWERAVLARPYAGLTMLFRAPPDEGARLVRLADGLVLALARERRVFVDDIEARAWFTKEEWKGVSEAWDGEVPQVPRHITFHAYQDGDFLRIVSLGMKKFGRPDLVLEGIPRAAAPEMGALLNAVAQEIVEKGLPASGILQIQARGKELPLRLAEGRREEGDADNPLVSLDVSGFAGGTLQERISTLATAWGGGPAPMTMVPSGDVELEAASAAARKRLLEDVKPRFLAGLPEGEALTVKGPFGPRNETEWMWLTVRSWEGGMIRGLLVEDAWNDPKLKAGMEVLMPEGAVFDYQIFKRDGTSEGATTDEILKQRQRGG